MTPHDKLIDLSGKTAIVTGGGVGIGFGIAHRLAEAGANVLIVDIHEDRAKKAAEKLTGAGFSAEAVTCDVSSEEQVAAMVRGGSRCVRWHRHSGQ